LGECEGCGAEIPDYPKDTSSISMVLCKECWRLWFKFSGKYGDAITHKYGNGINHHNSRWAIFIGELKDTEFKTPIKRKQPKERVEFT
jgi:hypothetical protein